MTDKQKWNSTPCRLSSTSCCGCTVRGCSSFIWENVIQVRSSSQTQGQLTGQEQSAFFVASGRSQSIKKSFINIFNDWKDLVWPVTQIRRVQAQRTLGHAAQPRHLHWIQNATIIRLRTVCKRSYKNVFITTNAPAGVWRELFWFKRESFVRPLTAL